MSAPALRRGSEFLHAHWFNPDTGKPLRCRVTQIRDGGVYWREIEADGTTSRAPAYFFTFEQAERYVREVLA